MSNEDGVYERLPDHQGSTEAGLKVYSLATTSGNVTKPPYHSFPRILTATPNPRSSLSPPRHSPLRITSHASTLGTQLPCADTLPSSKHRRWWMKLQPVMPDIRGARSRDQEGISGSGVGGGEGQWPGAGSATVVMTRGVAGDTGCSSSSSS